MVTTQVRQLAQMPPLHRELSPKYRCQLFVQLYHEESLHGNESIRNEKFVKWLRKILTRHGMTFLADEQSQSDYFYSNSITVISNKQ